MLSRKNYKAIGTILKGYSDEYLINDDIKQTDR